MKRTLLAVALLGAGVAQAAELIIFKEPNFRGESDTIKGEVARLEGGFANKASSLVVRGGYWEVCTEHHFNGDCYVIPPGEYGRLGRQLSNNIVSVRFVGQRAPRNRELWAFREDGPHDRRWDDERRGRRDRASYGSVELYGQPNFRGRSIHVDDDIVNLQGSRWDGRASSVIVNDGVWQMCSEPRFEGVCATLRPGRYEHLAQLNNRVSSMRQVR